MIVPQPEIFCVIMRLHCGHFFQLGVPPQLQCDAVVVVAAIAILWLHVVIASCGMQSKALVFKDFYFVLEIYLFIYFYNVETRN